MIGTTFYARLNSARHRKGFTLIEIAIVLSVMGFILAAVWLEASNVSVQKKVIQTNTDSSFIIQKIRSIYISSSTTGLTDGTDQTAAFQNLNVFPTDMGTSYPPTTAWGSLTTVMVTSQSKITSPANKGDAFEIEFNSMPTKACIALLVALGGTSRDPGLFYATASTIAQGALTLVGRPASLVLPVTVKNATAACSQASIVSVQLAFGLNG